MAFDFDKAARRKKRPARKPAGDPEPEELTEEEKGYRERAKRENDRRKMATDGSTFTCFCFCDTEDRDSFVSMLGLEPIEGRYVFVEDMEEAFDRVGYTRPKMAYRQPMRIASEPVANPCCDLEMTGDPERDIEAQFMAMFHAFQARENRERYKCALDSPYWVAVIFRSADDRDTFVREWGFIRYGFQYVDGSKILKDIERKTAA